MLRCFNHSLEEKAVDVSFVSTVGLSDPQRENPVRQDCHVQRVSGGLQRSRSDYGDTSLTTFHNVSKTKFQSFNRIKQYSTGITKLPLFPHRRVGGHLTSFLVSHVSKDLQL